MKRAVVGKVISLVTTLALVLSMFSGYSMVYAAGAFSVDTLIEAEDTTLGKARKLLRTKTRAAGSRLPRRANGSTTVDSKKPGCGFFC